MNPFSTAQATPAPTPLQLVLIHGAGHDRRVWNGLADQLAASGLHPLALDLPGHGQSTEAPCQDIESMAAWLVEQLHESVNGPVALAGHSMGSLVALEACAQAPTLFSHLILIGSAFPMPVAQGLLDAAQNDTESAYGLINKWSFGPDSADCLKEDNLGLMREQAAGVLFRDLSACNAYQGGLEAASRVRCPVCLISGNSDRMTPVKSLVVLQQALEQTQDDVSMMSLERIGHSVMSEAPDIAAANIATWLETRRTQRDAGTA